MKRIDGPGPLRWVAGWTTRGVVRRIVALVIAGLAMYAVWPAFVQVITAWPDLSELDPVWFLILLLFEALSLTSMWQLFRIALHRSGWLLPATSHLTGIALSRLVPGGGATGAAVQYRMITQAGVGSARAASAITAVNLLSSATALALPLLAVPAIIGGLDVDRRIAQALIIGGGILGATAVLVAFSLASERPLRLLGRVAQWVQNRFRTGHPPLQGLDDSLIAERNFILQVFGWRWKSAVIAALGRSFFEFLALLSALTAVGAEVSPSLVLLAYVVAAILASIPITPGGLGFVEAGLVTILGVAGVSTGDASAATLIYRLFTFWLPMPSGFASYFIYQRSFSGGRNGEAATETLEVEAANPGNPGEGSGEDDPEDG